VYKKLSFIIPVYNEEKTLVTLLDKVEQANLGIEKEVVLVDDGSTDGTLQILERYINKPGYKVLYNEHNMGKSQTVKVGILASTGDLVVIQDADLEYDPAELDKFVQIFSKDEADVVYGNRFAKQNKVIYWQNWVGNTFLSYVSGLFTGLRSGMWTRDMEVCYKMARGDVFRSIGQTIVSRSTFGLEPELSAKFSKFRLAGRKLRFRQLPISYYPRTIAEGKHMHAFKDGFKALWEIFRFNFFK
jgi:glycosyltransferase involved in cell wall biosynthesis